MKTSRDDGIKQFSIQHPTYFSHYTYMYVRWCCILNCFMPSSLLAFILLLFCYPTISIHFLCFLHLYYIGAYARTCVTCVIYRHPALSLSTQRVISLLNESLLQVTGCCSNACTVPAGLTLFVCVYGDVLTMGKV